MPRTTRSKKPNHNLKEYLRCKRLGIPYVSKTPTKIQQKVEEDKRNLKTNSEKKFNNTFKEGQSEDQIESMTNSNADKNKVAHCSKLSEIDDSQLLKVLLAEKLVKIGTKQKINTNKKKEKYKKVKRNKFLNNYNLDVPLTVQKIRANFAKLLEKNCTEVQRNSNKVLTGIEIKTELCEEKIQFNFEHQVGERTSGEILTKPESTGSLEEEGFKIKTEQCEDTKEGIIKTELN